jgi:hypothetical protein
MSGDVHVEQPASLTLSHPKPIPWRRRRPGRAAVYSVREAAGLLGCSVDALERHHTDFRGYRVGRRIFFPRWAIDRLVCDPEASGSGDAAQGSPAGSPVERVLALLPLLSDGERVRVAQAALTPGGLSEHGGAR